MPVFFSVTQLVIATHNPGKIPEFQKLLALPGIELIAASALGLPEPEETGKSFAENARLKAIAAARAANLPALADDSGLAIDALNGAPGIYSARWAGPAKNFAQAMEKIESLLREKNIAPTGVKAAFIAALALALSDGTLIEAEGRVTGTLHFPPRGANGFGYDPIFIPDGETRTFAEMGAEEKARHSHRARAVAALKQKMA